jgi:hypothetical protein
VSPQSFDPGVFVAPAVPVLVGRPPPDWVPDGDGEPEPLADGDPDPGDGEPLGLPDPDDGDPDCGELDWGGGLPELPVGGGGVCGGWCRKIKIAISTASAASSNISSQETRMVRQPARSKRPGQGRGQSRASPGRTLSIQ